MNRCYRLVWNRARQVFVVASEVSRGRGKSGRTVRTRPLAWLAALPLSLSPMLSMAAVQVAISGAMPVPRMALPTLPVATPIVSSTTSPSGGQVTVGSGNISQSGLTTTINQHSQNLSLNWQSFNVGAQSTVNFVQPNAQSIAVNRIADANGSVILGRLNANGQVFLINPNGVLFGQGAQVNVGGLVASTLNIDDGELAGGTRHFSGNDSGRGSVVNRGTINAAKGGYVALLGPQVTNHGTLDAPGGTVALAGGNAVTLSFDSNRLLSLQVDKSTLNALADNRQLIVANGGQVLMSAGAKNSLLASVVNNSGTIQAQTVENRAGKIVLLGGMATGTTKVAGTLDASAPTGGHGGFIETSAAHVQVAEGTRITALAAVGDTGTWLIDPVDFTIAASGGDMTGALLSSSLASADVIIQSTAGASGTAGDINVNDRVSWSANQLTLNAQNNVNINADLNGSGTARLALEYGQATADGTGSGYTLRGGQVNLAAGNNFSTKQGLNGNTVIYTVINSLGEAGSTTGTDLQGMNGNLSGNYVLGSNIDASATSDWNGGAGFAPITNYESVIDPYCGECDPEMRPIPFTGRFDGLGHVISSLSIARPAESNVGLFGVVQSGATVKNVGLVGGSVTGYGAVGALVGINHGAINNSYATANSNGISSVGGLVGSNGGAISSSYATGNINDVASIDVGIISSIGGLVGSNNGVIDNSYSTGNVNGTNYMGGLVGSNESTGMIRNSYATGNVVDDYNYRGNYFNGGLVGFNTAQISTSYASGSVVNNIYNGGLVGYSALGGTVTNSYWNSTANTKGIGVNNNSATTTGLSATEVQIAANFVGFNFTSTPGAAGNNWVMVDGDGSLNNAGGAAGAIRPMLASEYSTTISNAHQLQLMAMDLGANYLLAYDIDMGELADAAGMWSSAGFAPIGKSTTQFTGSFDGLGHSITGLTINRPTMDYVGLFGSTAAASEVRNIGLVSVSLAGADGQVGALIGSNQGKVSNSYATGTVIGATHVGGLVGDNLGTIDGSYFSGSVTAGNRLGGLVGVNTGGISNSYSTGQVISSAAQDLIGGLVGDNSGGTISTSYASANVFNSNTDLNRHTGGLVGSNSGTVNNSYWDLSASALPGIDGGTTTGATGLTSAQMKQQSSFAGWDLASAGGSNAVWRIYAGYTSPLLRSFMTNLAITANVTTTYSGSAFVGSTEYTFGSLTPSQWLPSNSVNAGLLFGKANTTVLARNAGSYALDSGPYSGQMGYDINFTPGTLTINRAALTLSTNNVNKTYDGGLSAAGAAVVSSGTLFGSDALSGGSFAFTDKNVGTGKHVTVAGVTVDDGNSGNNYAVTYADNTTSVITALGVTVIATGTNRIYDGSTADAVSLASSGILAGDMVSFSGTGAFGDKNVGTGKTVNVSGINASGTDASNYSFNTTANTTADISQLGITVHATGSNKVYDGSTADVVALASAGVLSGDTVNFTGFGSFADKNVGTAKAVGVTGIAASGTDAGNYSFNITANATADITAKTITINATGVDKVYDGSTAATISALDTTGLVKGDVVTFDNASAAFADKNAGTSKTVTVSGITASGADAGNYSYNATTNTTADITPATVSYRADGAFFWTGQIPGDLGGAVTGLVGGDTLIDATDGTLIWSTPATSASPAGQYAIDGSGLSAVNYVFAQAPGNAMALRVANSSVPTVVSAVVAGLQQDEMAPDSGATMLPAPDVRVVGGGVRLP